jgi:hypothetical protein
VIYADKDNCFTHVARQLYTGAWTSKIGEWEDIEHLTLEAVSGGLYGEPAIIMRKEEGLFIETAVVPKT